jgi:hypothetical protein
MNTTEVSTAAEKKGVERDKGKKDKRKTDIAAVAEILAVGILAAGGMGMGFEAAAGRCGSLGRVICGTSFCS